MAESADEGGSRDPALGADGDPRRSPKASTCKGKSCKGCLYYSWRLKSDARIPVGVGIGRMLPQDCFGLRQLTTTGILRKNSSIILQYLTTSSVNLKWKLQKKAVACQISSTLVLVIQFSLIQKTIMLKSQRTKQSCHFVQALRSFLASISFSSAYWLMWCSFSEMLHHSQPRAHRSAHPSGDELLNRFRKNAGLVASGVAKNLNRVGNYIKESVDNILYPHRRRPK